MRVRPKESIALGLGSAVALLLLVSPAVASGPLWSATFTAPFTGFTTHPDRSAAIFGCASTAFGRTLTRPLFNTTTGDLRMGVVSATGCKTNTGTAYANSSELLFVRSATFTPSTTATYWVNETWNLSFQYVFTSNGGGSSRYEFTISVTLVDQTTNVSRSVGPTYHNGTGTAGNCCSVPVNFSGVIVPFSGHLRMLASDVYSVRTKLTVSVFSTASASTGRGKTSFGVGLTGTPASLEQITVQ